jgi:hypothetical protein
MMKDYPAAPARCDGRKPYTPPRLVCLGSVRALTLGSAAIGMPDAKATAGRKGA